MIQTGAATPAHPVTIVTGFFGAGKTSFLNAALADLVLAGSVVIVNEFGEIGLDHLFIESRDADMILLASGCLCCAVRGDLVNTLHDLLDRGATDLSFRRVIIETTGLADPGPVLQAMLADPLLSRCYRLDAVVTLVDSANGAASLDHYREAVRQVAVADRLVLTKTDLAPPAPNLMARLRRLNPAAPILDRAAGQAGAATLIGDGLGLSGGFPDRRSLPAHGHDLHRHDARIRAFCLTREEAIPASAFETFVDLLRCAHGPKLLRVKGLVKIADDSSRPVLIQGVQHVFPPPERLERWPDADRRTRIVFITDDLDEHFVAGLWGAFTGAPAIDSPDAAALIDNPLALR